jgi:hypothetical protein
VALAVRRGAVMLGLLDDVARELSSGGVAHALIGAGALAFHGVSRSTFDLDLLVTDGVVLHAGFWGRLAGLGVGLDLRVGDDDDPLAGVIRLTRPGSRSVDVVVGRAAWQSEALARATPRPLGAAPIPVVTPPDLVLLKLYAGGPQDAWDIEQLLALGDRTALVSEVEQRLSRLPRHAAELWRRILGAPGSGR